MSGDLRIFIGTFNLGNAGPDLAFAQDFVALAEGYDLVVIGFQEAHYSTSSASLLSPAAVAQHLHKRSETTTSHGSWTSRIFTGVAAVGGALTGAALLSAALPLALTGAAAGAAFGALAGSKVGDEMESRAHVVDIVHAALGLNDYVRLVAHSLLQLRLCVFCRNAAFAGSSLPEVASLWVHDAGVVPGVATKGTIGVSLRLPKSAQPIAFVCSHLAAHEGRSNMQLRNTQLAQGMLASGTALMESHAHIFVLGDLNYRLDGKALMERANSATAADTHSAAAVGGSDDSAPWRSVVDAISRSAWADLAAVDELTQQRAEAGHPLSDFNEGPLLFAPTYKVQRDTGGTAASVAPAQPPPQPQQQQQGRHSIVRRGQSAAAALPVPSYSKKRLPAWTDRVLWWSAPRRKRALTLSSYRPCPAVTTSDHIPLTATFVMRLADL